MGFGNRDSCRNVLIKLKIWPLISQYIFSSYLYL